MLTVKHVAANGIERVYAVEEVEFNPHSQGANSIGCSPCNGSFRLIFRKPPAGPINDAYIHDGNCFVMNEAGKTVAKYDLGGWPQTLPEINKVPKIPLPSRDHPAWGV